jgi:hypothetical protein
VPTQAHKLAEPESSKGPLECGPTGLIGLIDSEDEFAVIGHEIKRLFQFGAAL